MTNNLEIQDLQDKIDLLELEKERIQDFVNNYQLTNEAQQNHMNLLIRENDRLREIIHTKNAVVKKHKNLIKVFKDNVKDEHITPDGVRALTSIINGKIK